MAVRNSNFVYRNGKPTEIFSVDDRSIVKIANVNEKLSICDLYINGKHQSVQILTISDIFNLAKSGSDPYFNLDSAPNGGLYIKELNDLDLIPLGNKRSGVSKKSVRQTLVFIKIIFDNLQLHNRLIVFKKHDSDMDWIHFCGMKRDQLFKNVQSCFYESIDLTYKKAKYQTFLMPSQTLKRIKTFYKISRYVHRAVMILRRAYAKTDSSLVATYQKTGLFKGFIDELVDSASGQCIFRFRFIPNVEQKPIKLNLNNLTFEEATERVVYLPQQVILSGQREFKAPEEITRLMTDSVVLDTIVDCWGGIGGRDLFNGVECNSKLFILNEHPINRAPSNYASVIAECNPYTLGLLDGHNSLIGFSAVHKQASMNTVNHITHSLVSNHDSGVIHLDQAFVDCVKDHYCKVVILRNYPNSSSVDLINLSNALDNL